MLAEPQIHVVEVSTDDLVRGIPKKRLWIAAAPPEEAMRLVLASLPEGWSACLADGHLTTSELELLKLAPGQIRELTT
jgi:hypothetical protein